MNSHTIALLVVVGVIIVVCGIIAFATYNPDGGDGD